MTHVSTVSLTPLIKAQATHAPYPLDLSSTSLLMQEVDPRDQEALEQAIFRAIGDHQWAAGGYLEERRTLLRHLPQMQREQRYIHLAVDVVAPLNSPLFAPAAGIVVKQGYEEGLGNYGGFVVLQHGEDDNSYYSFYGHLNTETLPPNGTVLEPGDKFGCMGDRDRNGGWFTHTHVQLLTRAGMDAGYLHRGYCRVTDVPTIQRYCPSPTTLLGLTSLSTHSVARTPAKIPGGVSTLPVGSW